MTGDIVSAGIQGYQSFKLSTESALNFLSFNKTDERDQITVRAAMIENFSRVNAIAELLSLPAQLFVIAETALS